MLHVKRLSNGTISEQSIHKTIIEWCCVRPPLNKLVMHFPNEGKRSVNYGRLLKDLGMRPGVADLFIAMQCHGFGGAWIELKSDNGKLSTPQKAFLEDMKQQNYYTSVCRSVDDTIKTIEWYCFN